MNSQQQSMQKIKSPLLKQANFVVKYTIHMHPLTQIQTPDLLQRDKNSLFDITCQILYTALPLFLWFFLNSASLLINIYWMGNHETIKQFAGVCFGTILANVFVYYIIENISIGFNFVSSYFEEKEQVGFMYQKTLGINCFVCILATPILYFSDRAMYAMGFDKDLVWIATNYIWALIPNFYLYAFYQTTTNYLQSQKVIYPPIVISICGICLHIVTSFFFVYYFNMGFVGAAWSKNLSDALCCLTIYLYIIYKQPTKDSWIQWDIKATNNIHRFIVQVVMVDKYTFLQVLAFQIVCIVSCGLHNLDDISAHFALSMTYMVVYFMYVAISHCVNKGLSESIQQNVIIDGVDIGIKGAQKKISLGVLIVFIFSALIVSNIEIHKERFLSIFIDHAEIYQILLENYHVFYLAMTLTGFHVVLLGIIKTLQVQALWIVSLVSYYIVGIGMAIFLGHQLGWGLQGIWLGWSAGTFVSLFFIIKYIIQIDWDETIGIVRDRYRTIEDNMRISKMQLTQEIKPKLFR